MDKIIIAEERYGLKANRFEDDDFVARLNNRYTVAFLVMCIFIIAGGTAVGKQINCWAPAEFKGQHENYANSICWLKGSYYLPTDDINIPDRSKPRVFYISYYQWTAFILLGMGLLFLLPKYIWHAYTRRGGLNIQRLVQMIKDKPDAEKGVDFVKNALKLYIDNLNNFQGTICCGRRCPNMYFGYTATYFFIKILYLINAIVQFFLLNAFLSFNFTGFGVEGINKLFSGQDWFESPRFPRVTMCDFMVRRLGSNQHWYAVQCTLPINIFNEKIFLAIWVWLIILMILNFISLITWSIALTTNRRRGTIKKYLRVMRDVPSRKDRSSSLNRREDFHDFACYLHADGFLIFRIFAHNTDDVVAGQIIEHLYQNYPPPPTRRPITEV